MTRSPRVLWEKALSAWRGLLRIEDIERQLREIASRDQSVQTLLRLHYRQLLDTGAPLPVFDDIQFRRLSQNGEDGILLYIFALIGETNRRAVEICAGNGIECNTANLIVNHGWTALLVDGDEERVQRGRSFYARGRDTRTWPPTFAQAWVTRSNVDAIIADNGFAGEIDLLSLDMDGVDYWIWDAITCIDPRVVVVEYQDILGPTRAVTVPYRDDFIAEVGPFGPDYSGASLPAFVKLGGKKGYRLVGCERYGFNAFFMRHGIGEKVFPEIRAEECFKHPKVLHGIEHRLPQVLHREWVEV